MAHLYLMTRLYNTMDKRRACELERVLLGSVPFLTTYMPYRDSDEGHIETNWKEEIFERDIGEIDKADILAGYWDGPAFDEGIGFEVGYGIAKGKKIVIINDDFLTYADEGNISSSRIPDPLIQALGIPIIGKIFSMSNASTYEHDLDMTSAQTYQEVAKCLEDLGPVEYGLPAAISDQSHKGFVDPGNSRLLHRTLGTWARRNNYRVARRFSDMEDVRLATEDIHDALTARMVFVVNSGAEMTPGSSVLCGICYGRGVPFCVIDDRVAVPYSMMNIEMRTNLMIDVSCVDYIRLENTEWR